MTTFFSNPMDPEIVGRIAKCSKHAEVTLDPPWNWLIHCYNLKPPKGFIMESIFFLTAIRATMISFVQLCWYLA